MRNKNAKTSSLPLSLYRPLPLLLLVAASGCSALIYEIIWYQLLELVIGSTAISLAVLLAAFMGGLCAGALFLPRVAAANRNQPLRVYAVLEIGIGICGTAILLGTPLVNRVYISAAGHGLPSLLLRATMCGVCLLPPTILMGASLPAIARSVQTAFGSISWLGYLYAANTLGAVCGSLLAGFYLLPSRGRHLRSQNLFPFGLSTQLFRTIIGKSSKWTFCALFGLSRHRRFYGVRVSHLL